MQTIQDKATRQRAKGFLKLQVLRTLDSEILELTVADDDVVEEIQKADEYAERLQLALIDLERVLKESKSRPSSPGVRQAENRPLSLGVCQPENRSSSPGGRQSESRQSGMFGQEQVIANGSEQTSCSAICGTCTRSEFKAEPLAGYSLVNCEMIASPQQTYLLKLVSHKATMDTHSTKNLITKVDTEEIQWGRNELDVLGLL